MTTAWILPAGTDSAPEAQSGDYLLRPDGDRYEIGQLGSTCTWLGTLTGSLLPELPQVEVPTQAPDQEAVLTAARGLETAQQNRGG